MKPSRLLPLLAFALATLLPATHAQVQASLVAGAAAVQPGQSVTIALRFQHQPHWHTYWLNPGTGLATTLTWKLPPGWKASAILWPAPRVIKDHTGTVTGNGYEDDLLLPVTLTAPADAKPGDTVKLAASAEWLMCDETCNPGSADLALTLKISAAAPPPDAAWGEKIRATLAALPRALPEWHVTAAKDAKNVTLTVTPAKAGGTSAPKDLHFFADDNLVAYELPQTIAPDGNGGFVLTLPLSPDGPKDTTKLLGVLTSESGWLADGAMRGLRVETDFATAAKPVTTAPAPAGKALPPSGGSGSEISTPKSQLPPAPAPTPLIATLALAFVGGLILNLMPCVFPVLGIKILGFVNQAGSDKKKVVTHGLVFTAGVLLSFWTLATVLAVLRAGGDKIGWGFQLQSPAFVFTLAALMLAFALNMSGVFEFGLGATSVGAKLQMKDGYSGSFFTGVLATVVATPCSAPFLAPALGAALALPTFESFVVFTAIAVGLSTPYLLLSIFPAAVKVLPRPGAWMETFKQFMAFPLYATVGYLVWVLAGQVSDEGLLNAVWGLTLIALAVWIYGRWTAPGASTGRVRFGFAGLVAVGLAGAWFGWPHTLEAKPSAAGAPPEIVWEKWSVETVEKFRAEGRIIYVDFTARWCATCQANKRVVFHNDAVLKYFAEKKIVTLRGDWTNKDAAITAELAKYQRSAVPFNVIWLPGQTAPVALPELLTPGIVLAALRQD